MLAAWTELLPVFLFKLAARQCAVTRVGEVLHHVARPGVLVRDDADWWTYRVRTIADYARKHGVRAAEAQYGDFGKKAMDAGIRQAFWEGS